jgi:peroxiredoxin
VIVIFYLGAGCVHCTEQLQAFAPKVSVFAEAGISLVGISTENQGELMQSLTKVQAKGGFPIPLFADPTLEIFKRYRAYDDFEQKPLHGTFLVDGNGLVRWQDISFEPFMQADFLLAEAKRLLAQ